MRRCRVPDPGELDSPTLSVHDISHIQKWQRSRLQKEVLQIHLHLRDGPCSTLCSIGPPLSPISHPSWLVSGSILLPLLIGSAPLGLGRNTWLDIHEGFE